MEGLSSNSSRLQELDALRGVAALMVVLFHFTMYRPQAALGFKLGVTGVDLFFVISGFVIFMSLMQIRRSVDFIINRVSRLYPTYWACVTFTFLLQLMVGLFDENGTVSYLWLRYVGNMTMFQFYLNIENLDGPYWTMIIEMLFYIGILLLFRKKLLRYLTLIGIVLVVLTWLGIIFFKGQYWFDGVYKWIPLLKYVPVFLAGTMFYKIYTQKDKLTYRYAVVLFCLIAQVGFFGQGGNVGSYITRTEYTVMLMIYFALFVLFVNHKLQFVVSKPTLFLGKISFALYLIHQYVSLEIIIPFVTQKLQLHFWIASAVALTCVMALATIVTYCIEVPYTRKMKDKLRSWTPMKKPRIHEL